MSRRRLLLPIVFWVALAFSFSVVASCVTATRWPGQTALTRLCENVGICL